MKRVVVSCTFSHGMHMLVSRCSLNPEVDIGQIEGAFMMGVGLWFTEKVFYDSATGRELSDGTWVGNKIGKLNIWVSLLTLI